MVSQALQFLVQTILGLFSLALLLRFYLQLFRAPYRNPLSQFVAALTNFIVLPARRVIPGLWGADLASLVLAWLTEFLQQIILLTLRGYALGSAPLLALGALAFLAAVVILKTSIYILMVAVIAQAILSWVNPYSPVAPLLDALTGPFLRVFQKRIPPIGNVDLSPLFVLIVCQLILMVPMNWLETSAYSLF